MLCSYVSKCLSVNCLKTHSYMNGILMKTYIGSCNLEGLISLFRVNSFLSLINFSPAIIYVSSIICTCTLHYSQDSPEEGGVLERDWLLIVGETPSPTQFFHDCGIKHFLPYCTNTLHPLPQEGLYVNH